MLFDISVGQIEAPISSMFQQVIGSSELVGVIALFFFIVLMVFFGMDLTVGLLVLIPLVTILAVNGFFPIWLFALILVGIGLALYLSLKNFFER